MFNKQTFISWLVIVLLCGSLSARAGDNPRLSMPGSNLGPSVDSPMFLGLYGQFGLGIEFDGSQPGYGAIFEFRPGSAADILPFLYRWNSSFILQADFLKLSDNDESILSADVIFRKYFKDMRPNQALGSFFVGAGMGASKANYSAEKRVKYWSWLGEVGFERTLKERYLFWVKAQYRYFDHYDFNYTNYSLQVGAGIPIPW